MASLDHVQEHQGTMVNKRGHQIFTLTLQPANSQGCKGLMVYHHGFGEHCSRHISVLKTLVAKLNIILVTYDAHGHGRSGPHVPNLRAYIHTHKHLVEDLLTVIDQVVLPTARAKSIPESNIFLAGHSMGGMTSVLAYLQRPHQFKGLILSSPFISVTPKQSWGEWAQIQVLRLLSLVIPKKPFLRRRTIEAGVRDPKAVLLIKEDRLWYRDRIRCRTVVSCINGTLVLQRGAKKVQAPMYIQQGTHDATCSVICMRRLLPRLGSPDVTYHEVQGGLHDLFLDPETPDCVQRIVNWMEARL